MNFGKIGIFVTIPEELQAMNFPYPQRKAWSLIHIPETDSRNSWTILRSGELRKGGDYCNYENPD